MGWGNSEATHPHKKKKLKAHLKKNLLADEWL